MSSDEAPVNTAVETTFSAAEMHQIRRMLRRFRQAPDIYHPKTKPVAMTWAEWNELNRKLYGNG